MPGTRPGDKRLDEERGSNNAGAFRPRKSGTPRRIALGGGEGRRGEGAKGEIRKHPWGENAEKWGFVQTGARESEGKEQAGTRTAGRYAKQKAESSGKQEGS